MNNARYRGMRCGSVAGDQRVREGEVLADVARHGAGHDGAAAVDPHNWLRGRAWSRVLIGFKG